MNTSVSWTQQEIIRRGTNSSPSLWGNLFSSYCIDTEMSESYAKQIEELKEKVRNMFVANEKKWKEKLVLIDMVERLGLSHHFENEIQAHLELIFNGYFKLENEEKDLFITALEFRLLRQHGFDTSSSIFEKFTEYNGKFKENLRGDIKGLLSLYEAAHLRYHGEIILDEALMFSTTNLKTIAHKQDLSNVVIVRQAKHALEQSLQRGVPRLEARYFIDFYGEDELKDDSLLRLAKFDFNLLQMLHKKELREVSRWWKDIISRLPYIRDRVVECHRVMVAKIVAMISMIDDTYDSYGTIEELENFTYAVERWDIKEMDKLPDYMKICYKALLDLYDQYEDELRQHGRLFAIHYAKATMKELVRGYNTEAKWFIEGHVPPFADYMANGFITSSYYLIATISYVGMNSATKEAFDWLMKQPKLQVANAIIGRIVNDIGSYEVEKTRGQAITGIESYMNEYGVSKEEAMKEFSNIAENAWKDINVEFVKENGVSMEIMKRIVNLARVIDVAYKHNQDGYIEPEKVLEPHIIGLLVDSFKI